MVLLSCCFRKTWEINYFNSGYLKKNADFLFAFLVLTKLSLFCFSYNEEALRKQR